MTRSSRRRAPSGAAVGYSPTASDLVDGAVSVNCLPASGSTFALGTATVHCSATDAAGNSASGSFDVSVVDTTPPALDLPDDKIVEATGPSGAAVSYTASASDLVDGRRFRQLLACFREHVCARDDDRALLCRRCSR